MIRVTADTNAYVSAFNFRGEALDLILDAIAGRIELDISPAIIGETLRVLREYFDWQPYRLHDLKQRLVKTCRVVEPKEKLAVVADEPDNRILECAVEAGSDYIVTEDRGLLRLEQYGVSKIVRMRDFANRGTRRA